MLRLTAGEYGKSLVSVIKAQPGEVQFFLRDVPQGIQASLSKPSETASSSSSALNVIAPRDAALGRYLVTIEAVSGERRGVTMIIVDVVRR